MKIQVNKTFGNYDVYATADVPVTDELSAIALELLKVGLLYIFERAPSSAVEQKVFAPMLGWEENESGTSYKRPSGFARNSVPFTQETSQKIRDAYDSSPGKLKVGEESVTINFKVDSISMNESDGGASRLMATQMEGQLDAGMELALGITATDTKEQRIEKCHKFLGKLRAKKTPKAKK